MSEIIKMRLIAKVSIFDGIAYQTCGFHPKTYLGDPINICNVLSDQGCQEINLVFPRNPLPLQDVKRILAVSRAPTAVGGYGGDIEILQQLVSSGAEKVILSDSLWSKPRFLQELASHIGEQAISCSIDYHIKDGRRYVLTGESRHREVGLLEDLLPALPTSSFGELVLTCISRDGSGTGVDMDALKMISSDKPILLSGGYAGEVLEHGNADGVTSSTAMFLYGPEKAPLVHYPQEYRVI